MEEGEGSMVGGLSLCIRLSVGDRVLGLGARTVYTIVGESFRKLPEGVVIVGVSVGRWLLVGCCYVHAPGGGGAKWQ